MNSISRSILARSLMTGAASLVMLAAGAVARADTVIGADGTPGTFCDDTCDVNGGDGESVFAGGNPAVAIGGHGGEAGEQAPRANGDDGTGNGGNGGSATAVATGGSIVSASATGGDGGSFHDNYGGYGGNASATSTAMGGSGGASSSAYATGGYGPTTGGGDATATANASAKMGGRAVSEAVATRGVSGTGDLIGIANATASAKSSLDRSGVRSTDVALAVSSGTSDYSPNVATANAVAQAAGPGQKFVTPPDAVYAFAFSTVLPDKADVATLIGSASNVANALLGPGDIIFGTAILGASDRNSATFEGSDSSVTFDFSFRGSLILGDVDDDRVTNLGFFSGPIHLTLDDPGVFVLGGAVPETSTWAMTLLGFAGLSYAGYRRAREPRAA